MRIIPAIDLIDGKCVRLTQGDYNQKTVYNENPLEVAKMFEDHGISYLHLVDLDGAKAGEVVNHHVLEKIALNTQLKIDFSGGIRNNEAVKVAFESGADQVTCGSVAVKSPDLFLSWLNMYGKDKIVLGADSKDGFIATSGWLNTEKMDTIEFISKMSNLGVQYVMSTDIAKDGMLEGPSFHLYKQIIETATKIKLIASGGVASIDDVEKLLTLNMDGVIIGKALYEGHISMKSLSKFLI